MTPASKKTLERKARRLAERVAVDGRLIHPRAKHGNWTAYQNYGCRCEACTSAWSTRISVKRAERYENRVEDDAGFLISTADVRHGLHATYTNHGCRCRPCVDANAAYARDLRRRQARQAVAS